MLLNGSLGLRSSPGPFVSVQRAHRVRPVARAEGGGDSGAKGGTALSEDMIARLRAAEEEAARLKKQLSDLQQAQQVRCALFASIFSLLCMQGRGGGDVRLRAPPTPATPRPPRPRSQRWPAGGWRPGPAARPGA
jgi:hypothetical protein